MGIKFAQDIIDSPAVVTPSGSALLPIVSGGLTKKITVADLLAMASPPLVDPLTYKGAIDCSANPNWPAASAGDVYKVSVAGKIGGASGQTVQAKDVLICNLAGIAGTDAAVGANWMIEQGNIVSTADVPDSTNKRYVTDAQSTVLGNTSGTNSGDQVVPVKATGAEIVTGTDDAKFVTGKGLADAYVQRGVKRYVARIVQSGTDVPTVTVKENSLGTTVAWTRGDVGEMWGTPAVGTFPVGQTFLTIDPPTLFIIGTGTPTQYNWFFNFVSKVEVMRMIPGEGESDDIDLDCMVKIEIYP